MHRSVVLIVGRDESQSRPGTQSTSEILTDPLALCQHVFSGSQPSATCYCKVGDISRKLCRDLELSFPFFPGCLLVRHRRESIRKFWKAIVLATVYLSCIGKCLVITFCLFLRICEFHGGDHNLCLYTAAILPNLTKSSFRSWLHRRSMNLNRRAKIPKWIQENRAVYYFFCFLLCWKEGTVELTIRDELPTPTGAILVSAAVPRCWSDDFYSIFRFHWRQTTCIHIQTGYKYRFGYIGAGNNLRVLACPAPAICLSHLGRL